MSEPKLYKHNESGKVVAVVQSTLYGKPIFCYFNKIANYPHMTQIEIEEDVFLKNYTPLPEAPKVGSTAWAAAMMEQGHKVRLPSYNGRKYIHIVDGEYITDRGSLTHLPNSNEWQLYEEPKPIIEKLPHEFEHGEDVLVSDQNTEWVNRKFTHYNQSSDFPFVCTIGGCFRYCIPYAGNEHLEGKTTNGEHGAVPRGYVPPHVPKLGDDDYWQVGDEIQCMATGQENIVKKVNNQDGVLELCLSDGRSPFIHVSGARINNFLRTWYHKKSYVRNDGTVHEHVPTRPHRIDKDK